MKENFKSTQTVNAEDLLIEFISGKIDTAIEKLKRGDTGTLSGELGRLADDANSFLNDKLEVISHSLHQKIRDNFYTPYNYGIKEEALKLYNNYRSKNKPAEKIDLISKITVYEARLAHLTYKKLLENDKIESKFEELENALNLPKNKAFKSSLSEGIREGETDLMDHLKKRLRHSILLNHKSVIPTIEARPTEEQKNDVLLNFIPNTLKEKLNEQLFSLAENPTIEKAKKYYDGTLETTKDTVKFLDPKIKAIIAAIIKKPNEAHKTSFAIEINNFINQNKNGKGEDVTISYPIKNGNFITHTKEILSHISNTLDNKQDSTRINRFYELIDSNNEKALEEHSNLTVDLLYKTFPELKISVDEFNNKIKNSRENLNETEKVNQYLKIISDINFKIYDIVNTICENKEVKDEMGKLVSSLSAANITEDHVINGMITSIINTLSKKSFKFPENEQGVMIKNLQDLLNNNFSIENRALVVNFTGIKNKIKSKKSNGFMYQSVNIAELKSPIPDLFINLDSTFFNKKPIIPPENTTKNKKTTQDNDTVSAMLSLAFSKHIAKPVAKLPRNKKSSTVYDASSDIEMLNNLHINNGKADDPIKTQEKLKTSIQEKHSDKNETLDLHMKTRLKTRLNFIENLLYKNGGNLVQGFQMVFHDFFNKMLNHSDSPLNELKDKAGALPCTIKIEYDKLSEKTNITLTSSLKGLGTATATFVIDHNLDISMHHAMLRVSAEHPTISSNSDQKDKSHNLAEQFRASLKSAGAIKPNDSVKDHNNIHDLKNTIDIPNDKRLNSREGDIEFFKEKYKDNNYKEKYNMVYERNKPNPIKRFFNNPLPKIAKFFSIVLFPVIFPLVLLVTFGKKASKQADRTVSSIEELNKNHDLLMKKEEASETTPQVIKNSQPVQPYATEKEQTLSQQQPAVETIIAAADGTDLDLGATKKPTTTNGNIDDNDSDDDSLFEKLPPRADSSDTSSSEEGEFSTKNPKEEKKEATDIKENIYFPGGKTLTLGSPGSPSIDDDKQQQKIQDDGATILTL